MFGPVAMVTFAEPDCEGSSELMATMLNAFVEGLEPGAV
jgi:hypothetical protein